LTDEHTTVTNVQILTTEPYLLLNNGSTQAFPVLLECFLEVFRSICFLFNYNNGYPKENIAWKFSKIVKSYYFNFSNWPFLEISTNPYTKIVLSELQLYDVIHMMPFIALTFYHEYRNVSKHCIKNLELIIIFLQSFAEKLFQSEFSPNDLENLHECFLYPVFSALDDSFKDFLEVLSALCLVPLTSRDIDKTTEYLEKIGFSTKIQELFKYVLSTHFLAHKFFSLESQKWENNKFYDLCCKKSFLLIEKSPNIT
jgi:hypothetical protein